MKKWVVALLILINGLSAWTQKNLAVRLVALHNGDPLSNVDYSISRNQNALLKKTAKNGEMQFFVYPTDKKIAVRIEKTGFRTKEIRVSTSELTLRDDYTVQSIKLHFKVGDGSEIDVARLSIEDGLPTLTPINSPDELDVFFRQKSNPNNTPTSTSSKRIEEQSSSSSVKIDTISNPDFKVTRNAEGELPPEKKTRIAPQDAFWSVQVGAFSKQVDYAVFSRVPEFHIVEGLDLNRCFSGRFLTKDQAYQRRDELKELGFIDAFVVKLKGNEEVDF